VVDVPVQLKPKLFHFTVIFLCSRKQVPPMVAHHDEPKVPAFSCASMKDDFMTAEK